MDAQNTTDHRASYPAQERGSSFKTVFSALETAKAQTEPSATSREAAEQRILVVDDNVDAAQMLTMLLKFKGYDAHSRHDGLAGLQAAEALNPAAIIMDIGMPGLDGYETCRLIRQQPWGANLLIIALTGYGQQEDRIRALEAGFDSHLVKPVNIDTLMSLLVDLLEKR